MRPDCLHEKRNRSETATTDLLAEAGAVGLGAAQGVRAAQCHDVLIRQPHPVEHLATEHPGLYHTKYCSAQKQSVPAPLRWLTSSAITGRHVCEHVALPDPTGESIAHIAQVLCGVLCLLRPLGLPLTRCRQHTRTGPRQPARSLGHSGGAWNTRQQFDHGANIERAATTTELQLYLPAPTRRIEASTGCRGSLGRKNRADASFWIPPGRRPSGTQSSSVSASWRPKRSGMLGPPASSIAVADASCRIQADCVQPKCYERKQTCTGPEVLHGICHDRVLTGEFRTTIPDLESKSGQFKLANLQKQAPHPPGRCQHSSHPCVNPPHPSAAPAHL